MKKAFFIFLSTLLFLANFSVIAQESNPVLPGAYQTERYIPLLKNKRVGVFTNHTAIINNKHLIDTLLLAGISIQKIFTPEHGLRGTADAGEITPKRGLISSLNFI